MVRQFDFWAWRLLLNLFRSLIYSPLSSDVLCLMTIMTKAVRVGSGLYIWVGFFKWSE